jgi:hypothetical protein
MKRRELAMAVLVVEPMQRQELTTAAFVMGFEQ